MNGVREWAVTVVTGAVVCALVRMLIPSGRFDRTLRFVTSAFFLACLLSPAAQFGALRFPALSPPESARERVEERMTQASLELAGRRLEELTEEKLRGEGFDVRGVHIWMDNGTNGGIEITQVHVLLGAEDENGRENARIAAARVLELPPGAVNAAGG